MALKVDMDQLSTLDEALNDILSRWHHWQACAPIKGGFPAKSAGMADWRCSRQYDSENGAIDGDIERSMMADVDFQVSEMRDPYRTAIYVEARNLYTGRRVFVSPRLPVDRLELRAIMLEARCILQNRLTAAGLL